MRWRYIISVVGLLIFFLATTMLLPFFFALYYRDASITSFMWSFFLTFIFGFLLYVIFEDKGKDGSVQV